jgi:putative zinc finger protein
VTTLDPFAHFDGAYVLGALSDAERADFEEHLATCPACTARVRELAPLPALLASLPAEAYVDADDRSYDSSYDSSYSGEEPPETLLPALLARVRGERRRRHRLTLGISGLAAACLVALAVVAWPGGDGPQSGSGPARPQAMSAVISNPVTATAALTEVAWGTRIELACRYDTAYAAGGQYQLVVVDKHSHSHVAGSWKVLPGQVTNFTGGTDLRRDQIAKVEITLPNSQPVLQLTL